MPYCLQSPCCCHAPMTPNDPDSTELLLTRPPTAAPAFSDALAPGTQLGQYRIVALLGRGGMGDVYRAEQQQPVRRTVALKLLRSQALDARHIAYFELERQLLAHMRHPAIAQIFDAGTTPDGHPYFAMEFIGGSPITHYCDQHALSLQARIRLFIQICAGVQHAHQKGVIHRDLKPGNLLVDEVDGRALPKIIDFGIATASALGQGNEIAGTPDYMSPEQMAGDQALVDTRSDVYALGVVLCELLTGQRPQRGGETQTANSTSLRLPSEQLSTLPPGDAQKLAQARGQALPQMRRILRNELDWVVAKAMRHDRSDRYPSVAALTDDLQRFLDGFPVQAAPASRLYLIRKFTQRHRFGIAASALVAAAVVTGLAVALLALQQARSQRILAEQRANQLEKVVAFQQATLEGIDIEAMGLEINRNLRAQIRQNASSSLPALEQLLAHISTTDLARQLLNHSILANADRAIRSDFSADPLLAADLREAVARVYQKLGLAQASADGFAQVANFRSKTLGNSAPSTLTAQEQYIRALLEASQGKHALALTEAALNNARHLPDSDPLRLKLRLHEAEAIAVSGDRMRSRRLLQTLHADALRLRGAADLTSMEITNGLANLLGRMGHPEDGRVLLEALVQQRIRTQGRSHPDTLASEHNLAIMRIMTGDSVGAISLQRSLAETQKRRLGAEHPTTLSEFSNLANMLSDSGNSQEALPIAEAIAATRARLFGADSPDAVKARLNLSSIYARSGHFKEAIALQAEVADSRIRVLGPNHPGTLFIQLNRAATLHQAGQSQAALVQLDKFLPIAQKVLGDSDNQVQMGYAIRAQAAEALGNPSLAIASWRTLLQLREAASGAQDGLTVDTAWQLEGLLRTQGDVAEAEALRKRYILPLLQAAPDQLNARQINVRDTILDSERKQTQTLPKKP